jgi:flagellar hook-associated protein 2
MPSISFSGVASGLDTGSIVSQLVALRRLPIKRYEEEKQDLQRSLTALTDLKTAVDKLRKAAEGLDTESEFTSRKARLGNEEAGFFTATANSASPVGSFQISVDTLAQTHRMVSQTYATADDDVGTGDFTITLDGVDTTVTLASGASSLADLKIAINDADAGVSASIIDTGNGLQLMLSADESGAANQFTVASSLSGGSAPALAVSTPGADAQITIDGSIVVTSPDNSIEGALEGTTITLASVGTSEMIIEGDTTDLGDKLQEFADAYNELRNLIDTQGGSSGSLRGSSLLRSIDSTLSTAMISAVSTGAGIDDTIVAANIGLSLDRNGILSLDRTKLEEAVDADYGAVLDLFTKEMADGIRGGIGHELANALDVYTLGEGDLKGLIALREDSMKSQMERIDDRIEREERSVELYEATLTRKFTAMEQIIAQLQQQQGYF